MPVLTRRLLSLRSSNKYAPVLLTRRLLSLRSSNKYAPVRLRSCALHLARSDTPLSAEVVNLANNDGRYKPCKLARTGAYFRT